MAKQKRTWVNDGIIEDEKKRPPWEYTQQINEALLSLQKQIDGLSRAAAKKPPIVQGIAAEGRQGSLHVTWKKVLNTDGYLLLMYSDSAGTTIVQRTAIPDPETVYWETAMGNSATTRYFRIHAVNGQQVSDPSKLVSATSVAFGAGESAPTPPPAPSEPPGDVPPEFGGGGAPI